MTRLRNAIRLESEAILLILTRCQSHTWELLSSEAVDHEISGIPDEERREKVVLLSSLAESKVTVTESVERRAMELEELGFRTYDALHLGCAEEGSADVLLTTDDRFLRQAERHGKILKVQVANPVLWLLEVIRDETS